MSNRAGKKEKGNTKSPKKNRPDLTQEELDELKETFDLFDEDKSGTIDAEEISKALDNLGLEKRNPVVYSMINDLQMVQGEINFDTFVDVLTERLGKYITAIIIEIL